MRAVSKTARLHGHLGAAAQRIAFSLAVLAVIAFLLQDRIMALDLDLAVQTLGTVQANQWLGALVAAAISFWAVGRYDGVVHQHLATGVPQAEARRAGIAAIAISQTVGAGVITGALVRWRMLRGTSLWQATRLSLAVTLSFLAGWAVVTGAVLVLFATHGLWQIGLAVLLAGCAVFAAGLWQPHVLRRFHVPHAIIQGRLIGLTLVDTFAACAALYVLLPDGVSLPFTVLLPAFLLALGAGLASGTPGGVGPFEVALLALMPQVPEAPLLAAIMGWRVVYFAIPAVLGAVVAACGPAAKARGAEPVLRCVTGQRLGNLVGQSLRAEAGLVRQGHLSVLESRLGTAWVTGRTGHALIGMFDPIGTQQPERAALRALAQQAALEGRFGAIYKCSGRTAAIARSMGWHVAALGREAVLNPMTFTLDGPQMAALRRKLRRAEAAGITLHLAQPRGASERAAIARLWARARKGERGFSMGRYAEGYLAQQLVIVARQAGRLLAFASFHRSTSEWTLDLMRSAPGCPDGTMQAIVTHAVCLARAAGLTRMSLAAAGPPPALQHWLHPALRGDDAGLQRFKQMFAPVWWPLYATAPSRTALGIAAVEIARAIAAPPPVHRPHLTHHHLAANEIAEPARAWHTGA